MSKCAVSKIRGFTLIELLVSLAIVALLISIAAPRYFGSIDKAREVTLQEDLRQIRDAIDKHLADTGRYPDSLDDLVVKRYLRKVPVDPITDSDKTWVIVPPAQTGKGNMYDVHSGAPGTGKDGTAYAKW